VLRSKPNGYFTGQFIFANPVYREYLRSSKRAKAMNNYAFLCGINIYQNGNNLRGCVNDVMDIRERLIQKYGFEPDNIRVLTNERATKKAILEHLDWLVSCCDPVAFDNLVYYNSSHGTKFRIRHGGNLDNHETACLCPTDMNWDDPLSADILHRHFDRVPQNTTLTFVADACNSGNMYKGLMYPDGYQRMSKSMIPPEDILARSLGRPDLTVKTIESYVTKIDSVNVVFVSGCQDHETSADAYINCRFNGALTAALKSVIDKFPQEDWLDASQMVQQFMDENGFGQHPQFKGSETLLRTSMFV
jgi:hypothetical protein